MKPQRIQLTDIIVQLQQIDYQALYDVIKPLLITYVSAHLLDGITTGNFLYKAYKVETIESIDHPQEIGLVPNDYNKAEILRKQFGEFIIEFVNTITEKMPHTNLNYLYHNLPSIEVVLKDFKIFNHILPITILGDYNPKTNKIRLGKGFSQEIYHELLHMASSIKRETDGKTFCGFSQSQKRNRQIGCGLNEGYTQILTERYFKTNKKATNTYIIEAHFVGKLEEIVGRKIMEKLYFEADLYGLIEELEKYDTEENIMNYISKLDFLNRYMMENRTRKAEFVATQNALLSISQFLMRCYLQKTEQQKCAQEITPEEQKKLLMDYFSSLCLTADTGKMQYKCLDADQVATILPETKESVLPKILKR